MIAPTTPIRGDADACRAMTRDTPDPRDRCAQVPLPQIVNQWLRTSPARVIRTLRIQGR